MDSVQQMMLQQQEDRALAADVDIALSLLGGLWTGPSVPPLPPSGCYGGIHISSAISDGLGTEAAQVAQEAASAMGERPVKVLLPWYPSLAGHTAVDQTKPAKVTITEASPPSLLPAGIFGDF